MDLFWKIRHIPTGLFFKPSTYWAKAHLSKAGKVYQKRPKSLWCLLQGRYNHPLPGQGHESRAVIPSEWEAVPYFFTEGTAHPFKS